MIGRPELPKFAKPINYNYLVSATPVNVEALSSEIRRVDAGEENKGRGDLNRLTSATDGSWIRLSVNAT